MRRNVTLMLLAAVLSISCAPSPATDSEAVAAAPALGPGTVNAADGVEIAYTVHRIADPNLVLVHGWMCDQSYWQQQVPVLAGRFGVVNADKWPTNEIANQQYCDYAVTIIPGVGHFLMQDAPDQLNAALGDAVLDIVHTA